MRCERTGGEDFYEKESEERPRFDRWQCDGRIGLGGLGAFFFKAQEFRLLVTAFIAFVWAIVDFYDAFHGSPIEERVAGEADERDVYIAMKSSRTAMNIFNKALFIASVLCFWIYARCDVAWLLPVAATLCVAVLVLFVLLLCVNLYYEKRG